MSRKIIVETVAANARLIEGHMNDFWRTWAEDLIKGGVPAKEVVESMVCVATTQAMKVHGATYMADSLRRLADLMEYSAKKGVEYPATEH